MILRIEDLPRAGRRFSGRLPGDVGGADLDAGARPAADAEYEVHVRRAGDELHVRGEVRTTAEVPCDRCLTAVPVTVDRAFDLTYHAAASAPDDAETELDATDLDVDYYDGSGLDLGAVVTEQVALALPMKVLCRQDCAGICPVCGVDLNRERCDCEPLTDPRLEALRGLRDQL